MSELIDALYGDFLRVTEAGDGGVELEITDGYDGKRSKVVLDEAARRQLREVL